MLTATSAIAPCYNSEMDRNDDKELWDLLGQARQPRSPGSFTDNVLREIRRSEVDSEQKSGSKSGLSRFWAWIAPPLAAAAAAVVITGMHFSIQAPGPVGSGSISAASLAAIHDAAGQMAAVDLDDVEQIDDYLNDDDNTVWLGTASF